MSFVRNRAYSSHPLHVYCNGMDQLYEDIRKDPVKEMRTYNKLKALPDWYVYLNPTQTGGGGGQRARGCILCCIFRKPFARLT